MKKSFFILLLAAMLPCVGLKAQRIELSPSVQEAIQSLPDSSRTSAFNAAMEREFSVVRNTQTDISDYEDVIIVIGFFAMVLTIVIVCVSFSRRKQEARNALISKMVDNGVFTNSNADSAEMLKALMPVRKERTAKDRIITYASLLGVGMGLLIFSFLNAQKTNIGVVEFAGFILFGFGLLALLATVVVTRIEKKKAGEEPA